MQPVTNLSYQTKSQVNLDVATSDIVIKLINVLDKGSPSWTAGRCTSGFSTEIQDMSVLHRFTVDDIYGHHQVCKICTID